MCKMQLPYTFFFLMESLNAALGIVKWLFEIIVSTYQVHTKWSIHNIQLCTYITFSKWCRHLCWCQYMTGFSCLEKHCTFISLKALTISWENQVIGTLCCFLGVKIQYTCIWTGYGSFNTSVYPSKIYLKNLSPLSVKIATLPNSQMNPRHTS